VQPAPHHLVSLERLLPELHGPCLRWATRCCRGDAEAGADLVQELYLRLWDGRLTPPEGLLSTAEGAERQRLAPLRAWLFAVIKRLSSNRLRTLKRRLGLLSRHRHSLMANIEPTRHAEDELILAQERRDERQKMDEALAQLSARQRELIELVFAHELTLEQSAEVMGVSLGSARAHYHRAKLKLAAQLRPQPNDQASTPTALSLES